VRNVAPRTKDEQGQQKRQESPIHHSNVMHYSMSAGKRSRVGYKVTDDGRKVSSDLKHVLCYVMSCYVSNQ
jgi:large subunit ribosomal protein L24